MTTQVSKKFVLLAISMKIDRLIRFRLVKWKRTWKRTSTQFRNFVGAVPADLRPLFDLHAPDLGSKLYFQFLAWLCSPFTTRQPPPIPTNRIDPNQTFGCRFPCLFFLFISVLFFHYEIEFRSALACRPSTGRNRY